MSVPRAQHRDIWAWGALVLVCLAYIIPFPFFARLNNPNENVRIYMAAALAEHGKYEISSSRKKWGWTNDAACVDSDGEAFFPCDKHRPGFERRYYAAKAPGISMLGAPVLWLLNRATDDLALREITWLLRLVVVKIPSLIFIVVGFLWIRRRVADPVLAMASWGALALGSTYYAHGILFVSHSLAGVVAFSAFMIGERRAPSLGAAFVAGLLGAAATAFEYPCALLSASLAVRWLLHSYRKPSRLLAYALGVSLPALAVAHFHASAFGSVLTPGHSFAETALFREIHTSGVVGIHFPDPDAIAGLFVSPRVGLFVSSPIFFLAVLGVCIGAHRGRGASFSILVTCLLTLGVAGFPWWHGAWTLGPRYLAPVAPFVAYVLASTPLSRWTPSLRWSAVMLGGISILVTGTLALRFPHLPPSLEYPFLALRHLVEAGQPQIVHGGSWAGLLLNLSLPVAFVVGLRAMGVQWRVLASALGVSLCLVAGIWRMSSAPESAVHALVQDVRYQSSLQLLDAERNRM